MFHAQNAALAKDDGQMRSSIRNAIDELEAPLKDIGKFNNTVKGWKTYSDLRMLALLYRAVLAITSYVTFSDSLNVKAEFVFAILVNFTVVICRGHASCNVALVSLSRVLHL